MAPGVLFDVVDSYPIGTNGSEFTGDCRTALGWQRTSRRCLTRMSLDYELDNLAAEKPEPDLPPAVASATIGAFERSFFCVRSNVSHQVVTLFKASQTNATLEDFCFEGWLLWRQTWISLLGHGLKLVVEQKRVVFQRVHAFCNDN